MPVDVVTRLDPGHEAHPKPWSEGFWGMVVGLRFGGTVRLKCRPRMGCENTRGRKSCGGEDFGRTVPGRKQK